MAKYPVPKDSQHIHALIQIQPLPTCHGGLHSFEHTLHRVIDAANDRHLALAKIASFVHKQLVQGGDITTVSLMPEYALPIIVLIKRHPWLPALYPQLLYFTSISINGFSKLDVEVLKSASWPPAHLDTFYTHSTAPFANLCTAFTAQPHSNKSVPKLPLIRPTLLGPVEVFNLRQDGRAHKAVFHSERIALYTQHDIRLIASTPDDFK
mmetsp:Transcript_34457/g.64246  ORF Transcript_34457/g.64246 Transcript_34457/m.64246 type:complete len:209 (-) Transcript_34457:107-733(-)